MNKEKALKNQGLEFREDIIVWGGILVEHSASARIPANNFFFIHSPLLSLYMIFCVLTLLSSVSEFDT